MSEFDHTHRALDGLAKAIHQRVTTPHQEAGELFVKRAQLTGCLTNLFFIQGFGYIRSDLYSRILLFFSDVYNRCVLFNSSQQLIELDC